MDFVLPNQLFPDKVGGENSTVPISLRFHLAIRYQTDGIRDYLSI